MNYWLRVDLRDFTVSLSCLKKLTKTSEGMLYTPMQHTHIPNIWGIEQKNISDLLKENRFYNFGAKYHTYKKLSDFFHFGICIPYWYPKHPRKFLAQLLFSVNSYDIIDFLTKITDFNMTIATLCMELVSQKFVGVYRVPIGYTDTKMKEIGQFL